MSRPRTRSRLKNKPFAKNSPCQHVAPVVERNMTAVDQYRSKMERRKGISDHVADWMTRWSGSMTFVYMHALWFGIWVPYNLGWFGLTPFDPYPFGLLTTIVSLEAIFLATFVLVSQNRQAELADRRAELDLQVNLLAEHEMTRVLAIVDCIAKKLDCKIDKHGDLCDLKDLEKDVEPGQILQELEKKARLASESNGSA